MPHSVANVCQGIHYLVKSQYEQTARRRYVRRFLLCFALVSPFLAVLMTPWSLTIMFLSHVLLLYATLSPSSQWLGPEDVVQGARDHSQMCGSKGGAQCTDMLTS